MDAITVEHAMGQLNDDANEIRRLPAGEAPTCLARDGAVGSASVRLAAPLRRVGENPKR